MKGWPALVGLGEDEIHRLLSIRARAQARRQVFMAVYLPVVVVLASTGFWFWLPRWASLTVLLAVVVVDGARFAAGRVLTAAPLV